MDTQSTTNIIKQLINNNKKVCNHRLNYSFLSWLYVLIYLIKNRLIINNNLFF